VIKPCTGVADADSHCVSEVYPQGDSITKGTDTEFFFENSKIGFREKRDFVRADTPQMLESSGFLVKKPGTSLGLATGSVWRKQQLTILRCSSVTIRNNDQHAAYAAAARLQAGRSESRRPPPLIAAF
jgi:hypothetical protein